MNPGLYLSQTLVTAITAATVTPSWVPGVSLPMSPGVVTVARLPRFTLEQLEELQTVVSSRSRGINAGGRGPRTIEITVSIMVLKKLIDAERTELEDLLELVYAIDRLVAAQPDLGWLNTSNEPEFDVESLETQNLFKSVVNATFTATA